MKVMRITSNRQYDAILAGIDMIWHMSQDDIQWLSRKVVEDMGYAKPEYAENTTALIAAATKLRALAAIRKTINDAMSSNILVDTLHPTRIPHVSHKHPTVIPLASQDEVDVMQEVIDAMCDYTSDTALDKLYDQPDCQYALRQNVDLRDRVNEDINIAIAMAELRGAFNA